MGQPQDTQRLRLLSTRSPHIWRVALALDCQTRHIGTLDTAGEGVFLATRRDERHLFKKLNSIGVCQELLSAYDFRWVVIPYCDQTLWTSKLYLLAHGKVFTFSKSGFERQVFLPLPEWGIDRARAYEAQLSRQGSLFGEAA